MEKKILDILKIPKSRKIIYDFNQAIKLVYNEYRVVEDTIIPLTMDSIKNQNLFKYSIFEWKSHLMNIDFLKNAAIDAVELNKAIKDKAFVYYTKNNKRYLENNATSYQFGIDLTESQFKDSLNYPGILEVVLTKTTQPLINCIWLTSDEIASLLDYNTIEKVLCMDESTEVKMILLKENFPLIKKSDNISLSVYPTKQIGIYKVLIKSDTTYWKFMSLHNIINY